MADQRRERPGQIDTPGALLNQATTGVITGDNADRGREAPEGTALLGAPKPEDGRVLRGVRWIIGFLVLAIGIVLVTGAPVSLLNPSAADGLGAAPAYLGGALLLLAWVVIPGPPLRRGIAAVLSVLAGTAWLLWPGTVTEFTGVQGIWIPLALALGAAAWLLGRGRSLPALALLPIPVIVHLIIDSASGGGWQFWLSEALFPGARTPLAELGIDPISDAVLSLGIAGLISTIVCIGPAAIIAAAAPSLRRPRPRERVRSIEAVASAVPVQPSALR